ncbi:MAG: hypothetical protein V4624_03925 [Pseudomonadota bacterium]
MHNFKLTRLAAYLALAAGLAACNADGTGSNTNTNGGGGSGTGSQLILDEAQNNLSNLIGGLGDTIGTDNNLGAFISCLDPTVNDLVDGPDALLTNLLGSINTTLGTQDPAALQTALTSSGDSLADGLMSLTVNLPNALLALADPAAASNCGTTSGGGTGGGTGTPLDTLIALFAGGNNPFAGTPLEALGELGGAGTPGGGPTGTPLDAILGPLTAIAGGDNSGQVVDQLGQGVTLLGTTLTENIPDQVITAPVVGGIVTLLADTLTDLGVVLNEVEQPTTADQLEGTLNSLLSNLTGTLVGLDPSGQLSTTAGPQIQAGIDQVTGSLGDALLTPLVGSGGLVPTLVTALEPLTCALSLVGSCTGTGTGTGGTSDIPLLGDLLAGGLPTGGTTSPTAGTPLDGAISGALASTPLAPLGGLLALLGL